MPLSKNRRKNGKKVIRGKAARQRARAAEIELLKDKPSHLTLNDLIRVVAYQESLKGENTVVADDATVTMPDEVPLYMGEDKTRAVGTVSKIPGDPEHVSINITDDEILKQVQGPVDHFSIAEENQDGR